MVNPQEVANLIEALNGADSIDVVLDDLEVDVENIEVDIDALRDDIGDILENITDQDTDESIVEIVAKDDTLSDLGSESTLIDVLTEAENVNTNTENLENRLDSVISDLEDIFTRLEAVDDNTDPIDDSVSEVKDSIDNLENSIADKDTFSSVSNTGSSGDGSLDVTLDTGGRPFVQIYYEVNQDASVLIETSNDENDWREYDTFDTSEDDVDTESDEQIPWVGRQYVRATVEDGDGDLLIDIAASR